MCAKQVINIGTTANDGSGDPIRTAFQKAMSNFDELYTDDTNDVSSIVATAPIERNNATGIVTVSLADAGITTAKIADANVTTAKITDANITTAKIADDAISYEKIDAEFSTASALSAAASVDVNFDAAQVFTLTPNQATTLNITNPKIGITKCAILTGAGGSYTLAFTVGGASGTFNKIAGDYDDTSSAKNFVQIVCVGATEFWYSISQIAS